ncbi:NlpC/P60 family protein [Acidaminococcus timonensis]|uniref:C40 family peptidase n=1 Tax=Acidaminococcus timonensis TaxID=1871002 RepID=UPI000AA4FEA9|nr:NlpC/P60 family protein [uncultured Acidaminococcus sp.]
MLGVVLAAATTAATVVPMQNVFASFKQGQSGPEVAAIQEQLLMEGYDIGIPDGVYGARTVSAVKKYQASMGLKADGIIGDFTYKKLMGKNMPTRRQLHDNRGSYGGYGYGNYGSGMANQLISVAYDYVGVPYVFGGTTPWGFDCSGYTQYVFAQMGIDIPRTADAQYYAYPKVSSDDLQPGDLVFFETYEPGPSHCGIYIGNGQMLQAGSSTGVTVSNVFGGYWGARYIGAARVL